MTQRITQRVNPVVCGKQVVSDTDKVWALSYASYIQHEQEQSRGERVHAQGHWQSLTK